MKPFEVPQPSPVDTELRAGPRGDGRWRGYDAVYTRLQLVAHKLGASRKWWPACGRHGAGCAAPSEDHVAVMAALGSGHEERMKAMLMHCRDRGWLTAADSQA